MAKKQILVVVLFIFLVASCNQPDEALTIATPTATLTSTSSSTSIPTPTLTPAASPTSSPTQTHTPTPSPTITITPSPSPIVTFTPTPLTEVAACSFEDSTFYSWHYQPLDTLSTQVQTALEAAGVTRAKISATAYGENVISQSTGEVCGFGAMETDFTVVLQTDGLTDINDIGLLIEDVLIVLDGFPPDATPGPAQGYITINFISDDQSNKSLHFLFAEGVEARNRGLQGADMLEALGYQQ